MSKYRKSALTLLLCLVTLSGLANEPGLNAEEVVDNESKEATTETSRSGYESREEFSSRANTPNQLAEDDRTKLPIIRFPQIDSGLQGWYDQKRRLNEQSGIKFGFDYNTLYQSASDALTEDDSAWSGVLRVLGTWDLVNPGQTNVGTLVFGVESRHNISSRIAPADLANQVGHIGVTGTLFNDVGGILGNLYYQQVFKNGKGGWLAGRFDPNDFHDVLGYANPWTTFSNVAILTNASIALPDWSWGVGAGTWLGQENPDKGRWYVKGGINDANGSITNERFFTDGAEFYSWGEVGWSPSRGEQFFTNIHVMAWHVDERENKGVPSSHGVAIGTNKTWKDTWMAWARLGWSEGGAPIYRESVGVGFGRQIRNWSDVFGVGVNWGQPSDKTLNSQWTAEFFYRLQLSKNLQLTPSIQYLKDPALNPLHSEIWVTGLRMRLNL